MRREWSGVWFVIDWGEFVELYSTYWAVASKYRCISGGGSVSSVSVLVRGEFLERSLI